MKAHNRKEEKRDCIDRSMEPLYAKIRKAMPGGVSDTKVGGRKDNNKPANDDRGC